MRVALIAPSRRDPAHRRVLESLKAELEAAGDQVELCTDRATLARSRADVYHVQFFSRGLGWLARFRPPNGSRLVLTHQGAALGLMERPDVFRSLARRASVVTAVSRQGAGELGPSAVCVPNGAAPGARCAAKPRPYILTVGRVAAYKGTDGLLLAFCELARRHRRLSLVVCGPDQTAGRMRRFAARLGLARRVRFTGAASSARVSKLLGDCMIFAQPSRAENMPMALLEAMAAGKPVVASSVGGVPEVIAHGRNGLLVAPGDPAALAAALRLLLERPRLRARLGAAAARGARGRSWSRVAAMYRRLYRNSLS